MKYVHLKVSERGVARSGSTKAQFQPFAAVTSAAIAVVDALADMRAQARHFEVEYSNG